jgi:hypothetical protein
LFQAFDKSANTGTQAIHFPISRHHGFAHEKSLFSIDLYLGGIVAEEREERQEKLEATF